jgi:hypothetical protein
VAIEAISANGVDPAVIAVDAQTQRALTLGQMIDARLSGALGGGVLATTAAPKVTRVAGAGVGSTDSSGRPRPQVPEALRAYGNGLVPRDLLTPIGISQHRLWGPAAESFIAMRAAAAADGVALSVTDSYRSYDEQVDLARRKGLTQNGGWAAVPGTSNHGWGLAIDADVDANGLAWLNANGARFGWVMETTREPWHWQYCGPT